MCVDKIISLAWLEAPYRTIATIFPNHRKGKNKLWVLRCTSMLLKRCELVCFFYKFCASNSHFENCVFVVLIEFLYFQKYSVKQNLHVLIDLITTNDLSIMFACLINIWPHFIQFCETQVFNDWWIHLRSKFTLRPTMMRTLEMNICLKSREPTLQR